MLKPALYVTGCATRLIRHLQRACLGLLIGATSAHAATLSCTDQIDTLSPVLANGFAFNASNTRNQASAIRADNVANLALAYTHVAEGSKEKKGAPAVTQQTVYFSEGRDIVATNRVTGCEYWRYSGIKRTTAFIGDNTIRSSAIYYLPPVPTRPALVLAGDFYGNFYGVNAQTGKEVWKGFIGTDSAKHFITGAPQFYKGTLFVPVATKEVITTLMDVFGKCCTSHGLLQALDPYSGKIKWTYHTSTEAVLNIATGTRAPNGMSLWGTPLIDVANNAIVIGTGQNLSAPTTANSDSIISLNLDNGQVNWVFQSTQNDSWNFACVAPNGFQGHCSRPEGGDYDFGAPPILATLPFGGKAIIAGGKNGTVYSLNPRDGSVNWSRKLGVGGALGGIHWGMAIDNKRVYAAVTDIRIKQFANITLGDLFALTTIFGKAMYAAPGATPGIYALDLLTGNLVWERHDKHDFQGTAYDNIYSAALSVTNDVLFAGSLNGELKALRTSNGDQLWSFNTAVPVVDVNGVSGNGGTIDSVGAVPAGSDLLVNSGYSTFGVANAWQAGAGNALFVFRLP
jgi:polyvinyl alcohol dehydrogenase (cytochrome)